MANAGKSFLAFISGAALGASIGLLYAPEKGEKTRKRLNSEADKAKDKFKEQWGKTSSNLSDSARRAKSEFDGKLEETLASASHKADDVIVSLQKRLDELREKNKKLQKQQNTGKSTAKKNKTSTKSASKA